MDTGVFEARRERLKQKLRELGLPALLVTYAANRWYLSGFELSDTQCNETAGWLLVRAHGPDVLLTDPRFEEEAARRLPREQVFIYAGKRSEAVGSFLKGLNLAALGFEAKTLRLFDHERLKDSVALVPTENLVEDLRLIKDEDEIGRITASCALNHAVFAAVESKLAPGRSEAQVAWDLERLFREGGATDSAFPPIVGVGANAALPHANPGATLIREDELVLVDAGCRYLGYCSDQTRTFWVGDNPSERFLRTRELVRAAQQRALATIRPGVVFREAYLAARSVFEEASEAEHFTHLLGHGIWLETHEAPSLNAAAEGVFAPGMVVTVEPGLYYPDWGVVRWEFTVLVGEDGVMVL